MPIGRRKFLGGALAAGVASSIGKEAFAADTNGVATRTAKVTKLFKSPEAHPNALETGDDGLWIGDQVSEVVNKVDWKTGKMLLSLPTDAHNTSGLAVGAGYIWIGCNGGVSNRRPPRPNDRPAAEILQADMKTGKTVKFHPMAWAAGGIHGVTYVEETRSLWAVAPGMNFIAELDPKDMRIKHMIPVKGDRPHGLDWDNGALWVVISGDRLVQKMDPKSGKVLEVLKVSDKDPDPHGLCMKGGAFYYCDAGLTATSPGTSPGSICRIDL